MYLVTVKFVVPGIRESDVDVSNVCFSVAYANPRPLVISLRTTATEGKQLEFPQILHQPHTHLHRITFHFNSSTDAFSINS